MTYNSYIPSAHSLSGDPLHTFIEEYPLFFGLTPWKRPSSNITSRTFAPKIDFTDAKEAYHLSAELPGIKKDAITLKVEDGVLTLSGEKTTADTKTENGQTYSERSYGSFCRRIELADEVDEEKVTAHFEDGVLRVILPKRIQSKEKSKIVPIS